MPSSLGRLRRLPDRVTAESRRVAVRLLGGPGRDPGRVAATLVRVLSLVAREPWRWFRLRPLSEAVAKEQGLLREGGPGVSLDARRAFEDRGTAASRTVRRAYPDVRYRIVRDALVDEYASSVLLRDDHLLPDHAFELLGTSRIKGSSLLHQGRTRALHRVPTDTPSIERAIHLGGYHAFNWYHWVAEVLPRVTYLSRLPDHLGDVPLLVPAAAARPGSLREAVEALCPDRDIISFPCGGPVHVDELLVIDGLVLHPSGFGPGGGPRTGRELIHVEAMREFRAALRTALGVEDGVEPGVRIFIDRDHDPERSYNREELLGIAEERGFASVVGAHLSLRDQAELFARAEFVIGPNGAGWTNVLFCSPGARGLCWIVPGGMGGPWFRNLGHVAGVELSYLDAEPRGEGNPLKVDYHVDPARFAGALDEVVEGW